jgi:hypothetical protein
LQGFSSQNGVLMRNGQRFFLKGVSWFGCETSLATFHGLWAVDYHSIIDFLVRRLSAAHVSVMTTFQFVFDHPYAI